MSFDIWLLAIPDIDDGKFDRSIVEKAFQALTDETASGYWEISIPGFGLTSGSVSIDVEPRITGFSVNRPPHVDVFWDAIYDVLRQTPAALFWPSPEEFPEYHIANEHLAADLPAKIIESLGQPGIVRSGSEIKILIENS